MIQYINNSSIFQPSTHQFTTLRCARRNTLQRMIDKPVLQIQEETYGDFMVDNMNLLDYFFLFLQFTLNTRYPFIVMYRDKLLFLLFYENSLFIRHMILHITQL